MAEQFVREEDEEVRAERAREFRTNLNNKSRGSRKRYSIAAPYAGYNQGNCLVLAGMGGACTCS